MGFNVLTFTKVFTVQCSQCGSQRVGTTRQVCSWRKLGDNNQTRQIVGSTSHPFTGKCSVVSRGLKLLECSMPPIMLVNGGRMW